MYKLLIVLGYSCWSQIMSCDLLYALWQHMGAPMVHSATPRTRRPREFPETFQPDTDCPGGHRGATQISLKADYQIAHQYIWDGNDLDCVNQVWIWSVLHSPSKGAQEAAGSKSAAWAAMLIGCLSFRSWSGVCKYSWKTSICSISKQEVYQIWGQYKRWILIVFLKD